MSGFEPKATLTAAALNLNFGLTRAEIAALAARVITAEGTLAPLPAAVAALQTGKANTVHTHAAADVTSGVFLPARLGTGTPSAATFLRGDGAWAVASDILGRVRCVRTTNQSIGNNSTTLVTWDAEDYDTISAHDNSVNPSRITVPAGAVTAEFRANVTWSTASLAGNARSFDLLLNSNGSFVAANSIGNFTGTFINNQGTSGRIAVTPGDYFEVFAFQNSGGALNLLGPGGSRGGRSWFEAIFYTA